MATQIDRRIIELAVAGDSASIRKIEAVFDALERRSKAAKKGLAAGEEAVRRQTQSILRMIEANRVVGQYGLPQSSPMTAGERARLRQMAAMQQRGAAERVMRFETARALDPAMDAAKMQAYFAQKERAAGVLKKSYMMQSGLGTFQTEPAMKESVNIAARRDVERRRRFQEDVTADPTGDFAARRRTIMRRRRLAELSVLEAEERSGLYDRMQRSRYNAQIERMRRQEERQNRSPLQRWLAGQVSDRPPTQTQRWMNLLLRGRRIDERGQDMGGGFPLIPRMLGISFAARLSMDAITGIAEKGASLKAIQSAFEGMSGSQEVAAETLATYNQSLGGLLTKSEQMFAALQLSSFGLRNVGTNAKFTNDELAKMTATFLRIARISGKNPKEALEKFIYGVGRAESRLLDDIIVQFKVGERIRNKMKQMGITQEQIDADTGLKASLIVGELISSKEKIVKDWGGEEAIRGADELVALPVLFRQIGEDLTNAVVRTNEFRGAMHGLGEAAKAATPYIAGATAAALKGLGAAMEHPTLTAAAVGGAVGFRITKHPAGFVAGALGGALLAQQGGHEGAITKATTEALQKLPSEAKTPEDREKVEMRRQLFQQQENRLPLPTEVEDAGSVKENIKALVQGRGPYTPWAKRMVGIAEAFNDFLNPYSPGNIADALIGSSPRERRGRNIDYLMQPYPLREGMMQTISEDSLARMARVMSDALRFQQQDISEASWTKLAEVFDEKIIKPSVKGKQDDPNLQFQDAVKSFVEVITYLEETGKRKRQEGGGIWVGEDGKIQGAAVKAGEALGDEILKAINRIKESAATQLNATAPSGAGG